MLMRVTAMYTLAHSSAFYITRYVLIPRIYYRFNAIAFIISHILSTAFITLLLQFGLTQLNIFPELNRVLLFISLYMSLNAIAVFFLVITYLVYQRREKQSKELQKKEQLESELQYLKAQVNPHFLFNAINSVYVLIKIDADKAADMLIKLSDLLRAQLYEFSDKEIAMSQEIQYLENYITLEKLRRGDRLEIKFERTGELNSLSLPPLLFIPFLENCFKHLSSYRDKKNRVHIKLEYHGHQLIASFYNTKDSQSTNKFETGGIGLKNIKRRLELLFPQAHDIQFIENEFDYTANLTIQLNGKH